ncbi:hypothetical protein [uncultured Roseibium sp.]|nr:hypothetical protein [uncultured Roseibium sp.]
MSGARMVRLKGVGYAGLFYFRLSSATYPNINEVGSFSPLQLRFAI